METTNIPLMSTARQYEELKEEINAEMMQVLESGQYIMGPKVQEFEKAIADYCEVEEAIGVANGTDALLLTLEALGIGAGDQVITTTFSFFATAEVISKLGARPVFVDIDPDTYNLDVSQIEKCITNKTKAIIPVHLFGQPAEMDSIMQIAKKHNLYVIEDACQAIGSTYKDKKIGSIGDAACFSFFPTKNLGGFGDGGMITTNNADLAKDLKTLRVHGSTKKYFHSVIGYNSRLDPIQAAALQVKLAYIDQYNEKRREIAAKYNEAFKDLPIQLPVELEQVKSVYHLYIVQTDKRKALMEHLSEQNIQSGVYYPLPLHLQEVYKKLKYRKGSLPVAELAAERTMALPLFPELTEAEQQHIITVVKDFF
ncbi:dTDP-4-amino-4,6-dideoxygalactose transaminase [Salirhabdus euzebyi]|uniref:dTDP-4-amino-4,6-dideoxygalactose transaminase n=1 Tax=Salirhabdus euzebyi TaxID=394506 RepID=A0A841Q4I7_9BACI|nr:DegT/DnrJ/EryC1/StrS family aminotransferase [Salirhabdus euzebyi]MBB6453297.1 dTDP-4-amino-4,6-dideoxygalactose transaminase [Salirhabdus euzebyi]